MRCAIQSQFQDVTDDRQTDISVALDRPLYLRGGPKTNGLAVKFNGVFFRVYRDSLTINLYVYTFAIVVMNFMIIRAPDNV